MELTQVRAVFLRAMQAGYAQECPSAAVVADISGYKEIRHEDADDLLVVDRWWGSDAGKSAGTTTIFHKGKPVWVMNYGGMYPKECIPFLKQALRVQYMSNKFNGGRGPSLLTSEHSSLIYQNKTEFNSFNRFKGYESIFAFERGNTRYVGHHDYWGMSLI